MNKSVLRKALQESELVERVLASTKKLMTRAKNEEAAHSPIYGYWYLRTLMDTLPYDGTEFVKYFCSNDDLKAFALACIERLEKRVAEYDMEFERLVTEGMTADQIGDKKEKKEKKDK